MSDKLCALFDQLEQQGAQQEHVQEARNIAKNLDASLAVLSREPAQEVQGQDESLDETPNESGRCVRPRLSHKQIVQPVPARLLEGGHDADIDGPSPSDSPTCTCGNFQCWVLGPSLVSSSATEPKGVEASPAMIELDAHCERLHLDLIGVQESRIKLDCIIEMDHSVVINGGGVDGSRGVQLWVRPDSRLIVNSELTCVEGPRLLSSVLQIDGYSAVQQTVPANLRPRNSLPH